MTNFLNRFIPHLLAIVFLIAYFVYFTKASAYMYLLQGNQTNILMGWACLIISGLIPAEIICKLFKSKDSRGWVIPSLGLVLVIVASAVQMFFLPEELNKYPDKAVHIFLSHNLVQTFSMIIMIWMLAGFFKKIEKKKLESEKK